jgi:hypothetical protein
MMILLNDDYSWQHSFGTQSRQEGEDLPGIQGG